MIALMIGLLIGFLMCIPVGPINVWVVNTFFKHDFKSAFSIAIGGSVMDFTYFMAILTGLSLFTFTPKMSLTFKIIGVLFLFLFGLKESLTKKQVFVLDEHLIKKIPNASSFFFIGVLIYTSNPTLIATMSGLAAIIKSWHVFDFNFFNYFSLSLGIAVGSAAWFFLLLKIVEKYQKKIPANFLLNFSRTSGVLIILFSLFMAFKVYKEVYL